MLGRGFRQIGYTLALVLVLKSCTPLLGQERPTLDVTPRQTTVPGRITLRIVVPADPAIRIVCWGLDGPTYQSSCRERTQSDTPTRVNVTYLIEAAGPHTAFVETQTASGRVLARVPVEVCATGGPDGAVC